MPDKLTTRLEQLSKFQERGNSINARMQGAQAEMRDLDSEIQQWMKTELGLEDRNYHISELLKKALETSIEPSRIITP